MWTEEAVRSFFFGPWVAVRPSLLFRARGDVVVAGENEPAEGAANRRVHPLLDGTGAASAPAMQVEESLRVFR